MKVKEGQCFTCYDNTMFQLFGQTEKYNDTDHAHDYISKYEVDSIVDCSTCGRKVKYEKKESGWWNEVEVTA